MAPRKQRRMTGTGRERGQVDKSKFNLEHLYDFRQVSETEFVGQNVLRSIETVEEIAYGGDMMCQAVLVAWSTIKNKAFSPHSFHAYFLKAGSQEVPLRYQIVRAGEGRSFANRIVQCYDSVSGAHILSIMVSFTNTNSQDKRYEAYKKGLTKQIPFHFQAEPPSLFHKYKDNLDDMLEFSHEVITYYFPREYLSYEGENKTPIPQREFGFFFTPVDDIRLASDRVKARILTLIFTSDSFYLSTMGRALGLPLAPESQSFLKVSLDHAIYFHDYDFDDSNCLFLSYKFPRMNNDRLMCYCQIFDIHGVHVATISQEALVYLPKKIIEQANGGNARL